MRDRIEEGDEVAAGAAADALEGVAGQHFQGPRALSSLGLLSLWWRLRGLLGPRRSMQDSAWRIMSGARAFDAADRQDAGRGNPPLGAPGLEPPVEFVLAQIGAEPAQAADLCPHPGVDPRGSILGVLRLLGAEDLAARTAGFPPSASRVAFHR